MEEDCPLAAAIRSGERDDLMWAIFRKMRQITEYEREHGYAGNTYYGTTPSERETCGRGHPWTPENTYRRRDGGRECRTCRRRWDRNKLRRAS